MSEREPGISPAIETNDFEILIEAFVSAARSAFGEMAESELVVRLKSEKAQSSPPADITVRLDLAFRAPGCLLLCFPASTAAALAARMLAGVEATMDEQLIRDCAGEIGNVIAGQAKTILADTPYHFTFSLPKVERGQVAIPQAPSCLGIDCGSDLGEFAMRLNLDIPHR